MRILVVDDEPEIRDLLSRKLSLSAHGVVAVDCCSKAEKALAESEFDIMLLDVMLPDGSGVDLCRRLRVNGIDIPILLLTARGEIRNRVLGLEAGADDYLAKPFALSELRARVMALSRRGPMRRNRTVELGQVVVNLEARRVYMQGRALPLTAKELAIFELLATRRGELVPREHLMESVWGEVSDAARSSLDVLIVRIRRKLGNCAALLTTVRGAGYLLDPALNAAALNDPTEASPSVD